MTLAGKHAVVVGGTHGIGLATAQLLQARGARVLVTGSRADNVTAAQRALGPAALVIQSDVTSPPAHAALEAAARRFFGSRDTDDIALDLLFLNVGFGDLVPFTSMTPEVYARHFDTNTRGPVFLAQRLVPLLARGSAIVFTTSVSVNQAFPQLAPYSASKAATYAFAQAMALELRDRDIRVNCVSPGLIHTPTLGFPDTPKHISDPFIHAVEASTAVGRGGNPDEVAKAVLFLAFEATFTTGAELLVDGGIRHLFVGNAKL
ncbi:hypothetical protein LOZ58_006630 [Ophidiomyces ophidiicola]|nr:hypothetical protein LOZ58_006630 [Ophidiomyces ophidiicola]